MQTELTIFSSPPYLASSFHQGCLRMDVWSGTRRFSPISEPTRTLLQQGLWRHSRPARLPAPTILCHGLSGRVTSGFAVQSRAGPDFRSAAGLVVSAEVSSPHDGARACEPTVSDS